MCIFSFNPDLKKKNQRNIWTLICIPFKSHPPQSEHRFKIDENLFWPIFITLPHFCRYYVYSRQNSVVFCVLKIYTMVLYCMFLSPTWSSESTVYFSFSPWILTFAIAYWKKHYFLSIYSSINGQLVCFKIYKQFCNDFSLSVSLFWNYFLRQIPNSQPFATF